MDKTLEAYSDPVLQKFFVERMGPQIDGDSLYCPLAHHHYFEGTYHPCPLAVACSENEISCKDHLIRLPLPIDWINPGRGLWGMVDWTKFFQQSVDDTSGIIIESASYDPHHPKPDDFVCSAPPTIALLRALKAQIGGKHESFS